MTPKWWPLACPQFTRGDEGLFFSDSHAGQEGFRASGVALIGLWRDSERPGVCGFYYASEYGTELQALALEPNSFQMLAFDYRTEWLSDGEAGLYITSEPGVFYHGSLPLPQTGGCWQRFYLFAPNPAFISAVCAVVAL